MTGACESAAIVSGKFPLVTPNWPNVSTMGMNPAFDNPAAVLTMFASAMPTSIQRSGQLLWKRLMPVEPCTSAETENTGKPSIAARMAALPRPACTLSVFGFAGAGVPAAAAASALAFFAASLVSQSARKARAHAENSAGVWPPQISSTNSMIFSPFASGKPWPPDALSIVAFTP